MQNWLSAPARGMNDSGKSVGWGGVRMNGFFQEVIQNSFVYLNDLIL